MRLTKSPTLPTRCARSRFRRTWATSPSAIASIPTTGTIIPATPPSRSSAYVLAHLPPCRPEDLRCGNIVLMHDGGGNRAETVRALPMIIDGIRARGYEIAPVYELLGKTRADVMAPLPAGELWAARLDRFGFWVFDASIVFITWIFLVGDLLMTGRLHLYWSGGGLRSRARKDSRQARGGRVLQAESCGADSGLQRRKSDRAHRFAPRSTRTIPICASL